jgi:hypothetical protein
MEYQRKTERKDRALARALKQGTNKNVIKRWERKIH